MLLNSVQILGAHGQGIDIQPEVLDLETFEMIKFLEWKCQFLFRHQVKQQHLVLLEPKMVRTVEHLMRVDLKCSFLALILYHC